MLIMSWLAVAGLVGCTMEVIRIAVSTDGPEEVATADFDGDGDVDALVSAYGDQRVTWWGNDGTGRLDLRRTVATGSEMQSVMAVDLDGDGDPDALSAGYDDVMWAENVGGSFRPAQIIGTSPGRMRVRAGDLDGDGLPEVLTVGVSGGAKLHRNFGGGTFGAGQQPAGFAGFYGFALHLADLDGDGDLDLATGDDTALLVCENVAGTFGSCTIVADDGDGTIYSLATLDLDGDGDLDLVAGDVWRITWLENLGGNTFGPEQLVTGDVWAPNSLEVADLDGDGDGDLLTASQTGEIDWLENLGGSFGPPRNLAVGARSARDATAADLDGDGDLDVLASTDRVVRIENLGGGSFAAEDPLTIGAVGVLQCHDLDGDGDPELVTSSRWGKRVAWYDNHGTGFGPQQTVSTEQDQPGRLVVVDVDGDGLDDVVSFSGWFNAPEPMAWYPNLSGGAFGPVQPFPIYNPVVAGHASDLDEDGDQDLIVATEWRARRLMSLGGGAHERHLLTKIRDLAPPGDKAAMGGTITAADIDGDGHQDLVFTYGICTASCFFDNYTPHVGWRRNRGNGRYDPLLSVALGTDKNVGPTEAPGLVLQAGDVDADGDADLVLRVPPLLAVFPPSPGQIVWLENTGGTFAPEVTIATDLPNPSPFALLDLDLDGDLDLTVSTATGVATRFEFTGGGFVVGDDLPLVTELGMHAMDSCDVDRDGDEDLVIAGDGLHWWANPAL